MMPKPQKTLLGSKVSFDTSISQRRQHEGPVPHEKLREQHAAVRVHEGPEMMRAAMTVLRRVCLCV